MMTKTIWPRCISVAALAILPLASPLWANDSTAVLDAGGLRLVRDAPVELVSEDLYISADLIEVNYVFRAADDQGLSTLVAFPLPDYDLAWLGMWAVGEEGATIETQTQFQLWVDGRAIQPMIDVAALRNGINITNALTELGIPLASLDVMDLSDQLARLPKSTIAQLVEADLIEQYSDTEFMPNWTIQASYFWLQQFPPDQNVTVRHVYRPVTGKFFIADPGLNDFDPKQFCMTEPERRGVQNRLAQAAAGAVLGSEVHYVLSTGAHWWGPISRFHLTVDKGAPEAMVSLCFPPGLEKTSPTRFEKTLFDYTPDQDLEVLFISHFN